MLIQILCLNLLQKYLEDDKIVGAGKAGGGKERR